MTAIAGRLMRINPFDQPGVEQGKRYTYGMMGRDNYAADAKEAEELFRRVKENTVKA
jgi:glucose-6-phosphate isomerase